MSETVGHGSARCSLVCPLSPAHGALQLLYAEPLCLSTSCDVPVLATAEHAGPQVLVLRMLLLPSCGKATAGSTQRPEQPEIQRRVMGLLFQGPVRVAEYTWPLVTSTTDSSTSSQVTAAMVLPEVQLPGVLQLVLLEQTLVGRVAEPGSSSDHRCDDQERWVSSAPFARLPLLFLPPGAAQEVDDLLAPAMRAEVAAAAAEAAGTCQSQHVPEEPQLSAAVWLHWQALVDDIHAVLELSTYLHHSSSTSAGFCSSSAHVAATAALEAAAVQQQVLPVVLGYLQQQGLHQCLNTLLRQLPLTVAGAWQQQAGWFASYNSSSPTSILPPVQEDALQQYHHQQQPQQRSGVDVAAPHMPCQMEGELAATVCSPDCSTSCAAAEGGAAASSSRVSHMQGVVGLDPQAAAAAAGQPSSSSPSSSHSWHTGAGPSHQVSPPEVTWITPWRLFPGDMEQQYLQYKHTTYLWLDRYVATFTGLYVVALVARMAVERDIAGTAYYLYYITCKCIPYISLWRGQLDLFFRHRERLITWTVQWLCMMPILIRALCCDPRITPAITQALHLASAGGAQHWQLLQAWPPFTAMMHLLQLLVLAVLGPRMTWGLQQHVTAAAAAAWRSVSGACSGSCQLLMLPESPMKAFWKLKGEFLVIGVMPIPQNVRVRSHVPSISLEVLAMVYTFGLLFDWRQVVARYTASLCLSICASWWWDYTIRSRFKSHRQRQAATAAAALARKEQQLQADES